MSERTLTSEAERKLAEAFVKILRRRYPRVRWSVDRTVVKLRSFDNG